MRTDDIVAGLVKACWYTAGAIFAGEMTLMVIMWAGALK